MISAIKQFFKKRREKKIARSAKLIKNSKAIREDRVAALNFICELPEPDVAVPILLQRFSYSLEHGINDSREKDTAMEGIIAHGEKAVPIVKQHLLETARIAWPIKILEKLLPESTLVDILNSALDYGDIELDSEKVDKTYDLLCYLRDYELKDPLKLLHYLQAHDERVRFSAVEILLRQKHPEIPQHLQKFLADRSAENTRLHQAVAMAFTEHRWPVTDPGVIEALRAAGH